MAAKLYGGSSSRGGRRASPDAAGTTAVRAVEANLWAMHRDFARVPGAEVHDEPGLLWYAVPSRSSWLNGASRTDLSGPAADKAIRLVVDTIQPLGRNVKWHLGPSTRPKDLASRLADAGFEPTELGIPGMAVRLDAAVRPPHPDGFDLEAVRDEPDLLDWLDAFDQAFGSNPNMPAGRGHWWFDAFASLALGEGPCRLFVGRVDGRPVACSLAFVGGGAVGLYGVGTVPDLRGRGFGSAATVAGMDWGRDQGVDLAILHASEPGEPVYRRLGFEPVCEVSQWLRSVPDPL
jgi:GNAT superfamily N-acetyltransferase